MSLGNLSTVKLESFHHMAQTERLTVFIKVMCKMSVVKEITAAKVKKKCLHKLIWIEMEYIS